ncbi:STAS/SEC14 domain-containing protein [Hamadaea sp. NPDC050747]|uniref:STAS/SEC14 domain-containing protein n=1 Tax=Hamadaea sp. NPDC050747 TaxID=3155789 RepID=UPI0033EC5B63
MITIIEGLPEGVLGADATGEITADDYRQVLVPAIEKALSGGGKLRMVYRLGPEYRGMQGDAMWQDAKLGASHLKSFERVAVVTDVDWIGHAIKAFTWMIPGEAKVFPTAEYDAAVAWLTC